MVAKFTRIRIQISLSLFEVVHARFQTGSRAIEAWLIPLIRDGNANDASRHISPRGTMET